MPIINIKVMSTIAAFEKEIQMQLEFLKNFRPQRQLSIPKQKRAIFCGTGDSYASALLAEVFSEFRSRAYDPLDLLKNKRLLTGQDLYLVSISGNTVTNVKLGKHSKKTTAITANLQSNLAKVCKKSIPLQFNNTRMQTAGSISFLSSALTCISLVTRYKIRNVSKIYKAAERISKKICLKGKVYILGNLHTFPVAIYCAAKLIEVIGSDANYERIEEFSHMGLFSLHHGDTVMIFEQENKHNQKLLKHLKNCDLNAIRIDPPTRNLQEQVLFFIFVSQLMALHTAKRKRKKDCFFVEAKKLRNASSSMIY